MQVVPLEVISINNTYKDNFFDIKGKSLPPLFPSSPLPFPFSLLSFDGQRNPKHLRPAAG